MLREDLQKLKGEHFSHHYGKLLKMPRSIMEEVEFKGKDLNASKYYQLKYFLNED